MTWLILIVPLGNSVIEVMKLCKLNITETICTLTSATENCKCSSVIKSFNDMNCDLILTAKAN